MPQMVEQAPPPENRPGSAAASAEACCLVAQLRIGSWPMID